MLEAQAIAEKLGLTFPIDVDRRTQEVIRRQLPRYGA